jgi:hypothetical protein
MLTWANSSQELILKKKKKTHHTQKRAGRGIQGGGPEFKPQYHKKREKKAA